MFVWRHRNFRVLSTCILLSAALVHNSSFKVRAQAAQAELTGEVRDEAGAALVEASVTITQVEIGDATILTTSSDGLYTATNLRPGVYTVAVAARGFRRFVREGVRLTTSERIRVDVTLSVGKVDESVTVNLDTSLEGGVIHNRGTEFTQRTTERTTRTLLLSKASR